MRPRVLLAVGKPPRPGTLVAEVAERLGAAGADVAVRLPHDDPDALRPAAAPDLLVHRGLRPGALAAVTDLERRGVPCCNPAGPARAVGDRTVVARLLEGAGLPVPVSRTWTGWSQVRDELARGPRVVKAAQDGTGRSARVVLLPGPVDPAPFAGPWQTQHPVVHDGSDRKLYVVGGQVRGLRKDTPLGSDPADGARPPGVPFEPDDALSRLALAVGEALGLHLYGVDVLVGPHGPVVVDVNVLPGYRGVAGAAGLVADHLLGHLGDG